jgi:hypothetical protein
MYPLPCSRSSAANSSSLTFVPMDFVRSGAFIAHRRLGWGLKPGFRPHTGRVPQRTWQRAERSRLLAKGRGVIKLPLQQRQVAIKSNPFSEIFPLSRLFSDGSRPGNLQQLRSNPPGVTCPPPAHAEAWRFSLIAPMLPTEAQDAASRPEGRLAVG